MERTNYSDKPRDAPARDSDFSLQADVREPSFNTKHVPLNEEEEHLTPIDEDPVISIVLPIIQRCPNTAYGIALGLAGHSILWKTAADVSFTSQIFTMSTANYVFWMAGIVVWAIVTIMQFVKVKFHFKLVKAECAHPVRMHFWNGPHLVVLMLSIGIPKDFVGTEVAVQVLRAVWVFGAVCQTTITLSIYKRWMFSSKANMSCARPQFLLSTVGWFLLSSLASSLSLREAWGLNLASFTLGVGFMFYVMVTISIFNALHSVRSEKGSPALFLLIAPPAVGAIALAALDDSGGFGDGPCMVMGWCLVLLLLLIRIGPMIVKQPAVLGTYWAYVFPLAGLATTSIRYGEAEDSVASKVLSWILICLAVMSLAAVFCRMLLHEVFVLKGEAKWGDPILHIPLQSYGSTSDTDGLQIQPTVEDD